RQARRRLAAAGSLGRIHHEASAVDGASRADAAVFDHPLLDGPVVDFLQADAVEAGDECQELLLRQAADDVVPGLEAEPVLDGDVLRSEEHTSELQSRENLVCRLLLEKKKMTQPEYQRANNQQ